MTVKEFIEEIKNKKNTEIENYIIERLVVNYLPYAEKIAMGEKILNATCYTNTEPNLFKINSPARKMLTLLSFVDRYTDIDIDWSNSLSEFDMLSENAMLGLILKSINQTEVQQCTTIIDMMLDDLITNERDLVSYIETKIEAMNLGLNALMETFNSEEIQKLIIDKLS